MAQTRSQEGLAAGDLLAAAVALTPAQRTRAVEAFFHTHPGAGSGRYGLGRAVLDLLSWEVSSGRIDVLSGSAWWQGVNGLLVLDLAAVVEGSRSDAPAVSAWREFAEGGGHQGALWEAHQQSLHRGVTACQELFEDESKAERTLAAIIIEVVDRTAVSNGSTDSDQFARMTDRFYPKEYPADPVEIAVLQRMQIRTAVTVLDGGGKSIANVGLRSSRWG